MAGQDESAFVRVRGAGHIRASKRLYMTATPRVHAPDVKDNAQRKDLVLASMDDESIHGPELYRLGFGRAVKHGLLTDYKVLVLTVSEAQVSRTLQSSFAANGDLALDDAARIVGCRNALTKQTQDPAGYEASPDRRHPRRGSGLRTGGQKRLGLDRGALPGTGDKASGIVNDPNDWSREAGNPRCALEHVTIVSPHTQQTVAASPRMDTDGPKT